VSDLAPEEAVANLTLDGQPSSLQIQPYQPKIAQPPIVSPQEFGMLFFEQFFNLNLLGPDGNQQSCLVINEDGNLIPIPRNRGLEIHLKSNGYLTHPFNANANWSRIEIWNQVVNPGPGDGQFNKIWIKDPNDRIIVLVPRGNGEFAKHFIAADGERVRIFRNGKCEINLV